MTCEPAIEAISPSILSNNQTYRSNAGQFQIFPFVPEPLLFARTLTASSPLTLLPLNTGN